MQLRRSARLLTAAGVLLLAAPVLTSCGFDYATDRPYTPGAGTNHQDSTIDVLGAVVVSAEDGSGTLITSFSNNDPAVEASVTEIAGAGETADLTVGDFDPIEVPGGALVNLADSDTPVTVEGDFETGDFLTLEITFGDGSTATVDMPSVSDCYEYAGLDASAETGTPPSECVPEAPVEVEH